MWWMLTGTSCRKPRRSSFVAALARGIDAATFTSSSSVTHLAEAARAAGIKFPFAGVPAVSIGPITSQTLRELGWEPAVEAKVSDIPGLLAALNNYLRARATF